MKKLPKMDNALLSVADMNAEAHERHALLAMEPAHHWQTRTMPQTLAGARIGPIAELPG